MLSFNVIAMAVQIIKIALFFLSLELPAVDSRMIEIRGPGAFAALHDVVLPHSNPRRR